MERLAEELPALLRRAGMRVCKIFCNSKKVLDSIPTELLSKDLTFRDGLEVFENQKVLGLVYNAPSDAFRYSMKHLTVEDWKSSMEVTRWTKRSVLRVTDSHFDPLGFASPITIRQRKFLQSLWMENVGWDSPLTPEQTLAWKSTLSELLRLGELSVPRCLGLLSKSVVETHTFCNASNDVYACAIYARVLDGGFPRVCLLAGKARVTPIKSASVSRSELDACVLGARLTKGF